MKSRHTRRHGKLEAIEALFRSAAIFLYSNQILLLFTVIFFIVMLGSVLFFAAERGNNQNVKNPFDAVWWMVVTMSTVGYGDIFPSTTGGRVIGIITMFLGVAFMSLFTATIASKIVERDLKGDLGMLNIDLEGHVVICGWNHHAPKLVEELLQHEEKDIVILANLQSKPIEHRRVYFVKGEPTDETDLHRANISKAETAIVLSDTQSGRLESADARVILTTLAIETINPDVYTCAEIIDSKNIPHLRNARVDEVITSGEFSGRLMATTAVSHGLSKVISDLLTPGGGNDLQKVPLPDEAIGKTFDELFFKFREKENSIILVAIERGDDVFVNPEKGFKTQKGDNAIIICRGKSKPEHLVV